jgi:hypothetical protein
MYTMQPTYADYSFIIENCPNLVALRLHNIGCRDFHEGLYTKPTIYSSFIRSLCLGFNPQPNLGHLAALFRFPNLESVDIVARSLISMCNMLLCTPLFGSPQYLRLLNPKVPSMVLRACRYQYAALKNIDLQRSFQIQLQTPGSGQSHTIYINPIPTTPSSAAKNRYRPSLALNLHLPTCAQLESLATDAMRQFRWGLTDVVLIPMDSPPLQVMSGVWVMDCDST